MKCARVMRVTSKRQRALSHEIRGSFELYLLLHKPKCTFYLFSLFRLNILILIFYSDTFYLFSLFRLAKIPIQTELRMPCLFKTKCISEIEQKAFCLLLIKCRIFLGHSVYFFDFFIIFKRQSLQWPCVNR